MFKFIINFVIVPAHSQRVTAESPDHCNHMTDIIPMADNGRTSRMADVSMPYSDLDNVKDAVLVC